MTSTHRSVGLSQAATVIVTLIAISVAVMVAEISSRLSTIGMLATDTTDNVIPQSIRQNDAALATESLTRLAVQIVTAPTNEQRTKFLSEANALVADQAAGNSEVQATKKAALAAMTASAATADEADRLNKEIAALLEKAGTIISDIDSNLASIADDSSSQLTDLVDEFDATEATDLWLLQRDLREMLKINTTSQSLLAGLRDSHSMLSAAAVSSDSAVIGQKAVAFDATYNRLKKLVALLPTSGEYEYLAPLMDDYGALKSLFEQRVQFMDRVEKATEQSNRAVAILTDLSRSLSNDAASSAVASVRQILAAVTQIERSALIALGILLVICGLIGILVRQHLLVRLTQASLVLDELSQGNTDAAMEPARLREIDNVRMSMDRFRNALVRNQELSLEQERVAAERAEQEERAAELEARRNRQQLELKRQAEEDNRDAQLKMADELESRVMDVVQSVASSAAQMEAAAQQMLATADDTMSKSAAMTEASGRASENVDTVAGASQQLAKSIEEISGQVSESMTVAHDAVHAVGETAGKVEALTKAADRIGNIVDLIKDVAFQTNLLALNASVEAARAGEAGRGFGVVAGEVRSLATRSAEATKQINDQIVSVQAAASDMAKTIEDVRRVIEGLGEMAGTVGIAVEQQRASTREIAGSAQQASSSADDVSMNIVGVEGATRETGNSARQVADAAGELSGQAETLSSTVRGFLGDLRARLHDDAEIGFEHFDGPAPRDDDEGEDKAAQAG